MSKINIYETGWLNMVFEGRNKSYGAYQLRAENSKTTIRALFSALSLLASAAAIPVAIHYLTPKDMAVIQPKPIEDEIVTVVDADIFKDEPKKEDKGPQISKPLEDEKVIKHVNLVVAEKEKANQEVATNEELEKAQVGSVTTEGTGTTGNALDTTPNGNTAGAGTNGGNTTVESTITVEKQPQYPGGIAEFLKAIGKKFNTPAVEEDVKSLKVMVYFVVEKDGTLSNIKVTRDPGYSLGKEALRVLNSMKTKWSPGYKNGEPVRTAYNLPIIVNVQ